jgi:multidrug efflux pump subunit AcrA (membrane-fusion protein)
MPISFYSRNTHIYRWLFLIILGVIGVWSWSVFSQASAEVTQADDTVQTANTYTLKETSLFPISVSGVVKATNHVVVRAKTAGEVLSIYAQEGAVVEQGQQLARQNTPIENAQYSQAVAEADFSRLQNDAVVSSKNTASLNQAQVAFSAYDIALLRQTGNESAIIESTKQLVTTLESAVMTLSATADFVDQNRSLFTATGMKLYRQLVTDVYSRQPNYLAGSVQYGSTNSAKIIKKLEDSKASGTYDAVEMQALAVLVDAQLDALTELLTTGEWTVFDNKVTDSAGSVYAEYLAKREATFTAKKSVQSALAGLRSTLTSTSEDVLVQGKSVAITEADAKEAARQADFAEALARASAAVSNASMDVVNAHISLGNVVAPFPGTVSRVEAEVGEYLQPGSPILTLIGTAGKELVVTVPVAFGTHLKVGQEFVSDNKIIGYVSRFSTVAEKGSVQVVIELVSDSLEVGDSITGNISVERSTTDVLSIPRDYVHFTTTGAVVNTDAGERIPVIIVYDYGETVFIRGDLKPGISVLSTVSGGF